MFIASTNLFSMNMEKKFESRNMNRKEKKRNKQNKMDNFEVKAELTLHEIKDLSSSKRKVDVHSITPKIKRQKCILSCNICSLVCYSVPSMKNHIRADHEGKSTSSCNPSQNWNTGILGGLGFSVWLPGPRLFSHWRPDSTPLPSAKTSAAATI